MTLRPTFVRVEGCDHGIGKLVEARNGECEVEFFESPAGPRLHRITAAQNLLTPVELSAETRVFCQDKRTWAWWAGRIQAGPVSAEALRQPEDHYSVRFPNDLEALVPISNLNVRWAHPIEDPTDYLAARITDTPFFFEGRTQIVRYLAKERAAFGGLTALASSAIELLEHQVTTVRRVLEDPVERYLLADEVGLGKTVEAGILIRQHVIDDPSHARVLVVVPRHLVSQWQGELRSKFFLQTPGMVHVVSEEDLAEVNFAASKLTMLVIDEAHQVLRAFDAEARGRTYYEQLCQLARTTPRVLLLSGTPVLHQEDGFLAMLHLLDPDAYPLEEREFFRRRVRERQSIADATSDLTDDASALFVEEALGRLRHLCTEDMRLDELCREVKTRESDEARDPARIRALRRLRSHLMETYRLHRRLLRTRRDDRRVKIHLPQRLGVDLLQCEDQASAESFDFLEVWRLQLTAATRLPDSQSEYAKLFASWVEAGLSHPSVLLREMDRRLAVLEQDADGRVASQETANARSAFETEEQLIRTRRALIAEALSKDTRTDRLIEWLRSGHESAKTIVFVSDAVVASTVAERLAGSLGRAAVLRYDGSEHGAERFQLSAAVRVLVCDAAAEEGLNLQRFGATVVHYDLPLETARIEQRIGRVDRLEARGRLRNVVFSSTCIYEEDWLACLRDAIGVFYRSIAPLQYSLIESVARIRAQLLVDGASAFTDEAKRMLNPKQGLNAELRRIRSQEVLDSLDVDLERDLTFFQSLREADEETEESGERAVSAWMVDCLRFRRKEAGPEAFRYIHDTRAPTLLPVLDTLTRFGSCIERGTERRQLASEIPLQAGTFSRSAAEKSHVGLLRVGHPIFSALEALVRADDRGVAFAMWRQLPWFEGAPQLFLRFDFVIETDLRQAFSGLTSYAVSKEAIKRRADDAFPIRYDTVWLDSDLKPVEDSLLITALELPYRQRSEDGRRDLNVRLERWDLVEKAISISDWVDFCRRGRRAAEQRLRQSAELTRQCNSSAEMVRDVAARVGETLQSRISRLSGASRAAEEQTAGFEAALSDALEKGMESPLVRADSAGVVFLANRALSS